MFDNFREFIIPTNKILGKCKERQIPKGDGYGLHLTALELYLQERSAQYTTRIDR
jgi:hypothetical protein